MVPGEENDKILKRAFYFIDGIESGLSSPAAHYLFVGFKTEIGKTLKHRSVNDANWTELIDPDTSIDARLDRVRKQTKSIQSSRMEVARLRRKM
jgi:hypothetical protein